MADFTPSHRNQADIQPEACDLCGTMVGHRRLVRHDVEGLRGYWICDTHTTTGPGPEDLRGFGTLPPPATEREQPIGGEQWWVDGGEPLIVEDEAPPWP